MFSCELFFEAAFSQRMEALPSAPDEEWGGLHGAVGGADPASASCCPTIMRIKPASLVCRL